MTDDWLTCSRRSTWKIRWITAHRSQITAQRTGTAASSQQPAASSRLEAGTWITGYPHNSQLFQTLDIDCNPCKIYWSLIITCLLHEVTHFDYLMCPTHFDDVPNTSHQVLHKGAYLRDHNTLNIYCSLMQIWYTVRTEQHHHACTIIS